MVARVVWDHEAAGSSPVTSTTRLSLDAIRVPEPGFFFCLTARVYSGYPFFHPNPAASCRSQVAIITFVVVAIFLARVVMLLCFSRAAEPGRALRSQARLFLLPHLRARQVPARVRKGGLKNAKHQRISQGNPSAPRAKLFSPLRLPLG